ncbi:hypothetical protein [Endomicrobium proavitum]|uniref:Uncharacterized protein n=1 Tax=Endomicrobium proavitum TaxID=1408281 RepID=A0A0G3WID8_9BACT|nr:hypothetical protein [Endomicrobium proavitum]AKL98058.1 exported protein of unknown function [Endomicrobium proavitum]
MRKILSFAAAALIAIAASSAAFAISGVGFSTQTARVSFTSAGDFIWDVSLVNANLSAATQITWTGVTPGITNWKNADQFVKVNSTMTDARAKIRIYSDNKNAAVPFKYTGPLTTNIGGLVGSSTTVQPPLPVGWSVQDTTSTQLVNPEAQTLGVYLLDRSNSDFDTAANKIYSYGFSSSGVRWGGDPTSDVGGSPSGIHYITISSKFTGASTPNTYGTNIIFQGLLE